MNKSTELDINKRYKEAASHYEREIYLLQEGRIEEYANLSVLYWSFATELFEFNVPHNIPEQLQELGTRRFETIINDGLERYPESVELRFWRKYFPHRMYFNDFTEKECLEIINKHNNKSLVPYFYLSILNSEKYKNEAKLLLEQCNEKPTAKNLFIKSLLSKPE